MLADLDDVLQRVAAGELSPAEALALLDTTDAVPAHVAPDAADRSSPPPDGASTARFYGFDPAAGRPVPPTRRDAPAASDGWAPPLPEQGISAEALSATHPGRAAGVPLVQVRTSYRKIQIVADPAVAEVFVTGTHALHRAGDAFVIENPGAPNGAVEPDAEVPHDPAFSTRYRFTSVPWGLARPGAWKDERLIIRVNPAAFIDVEISGGNVALAGLWGGLHLRVAATAVRLDNVRGPFDLDALTSSVKGTFGPTGASKVDVEQSSFKVQLLPASNLRIEARNRMGKVILPTSISKGGLADGDMSEATLGTGQDRLIINALMSSVSVAA